jgi:hypothetical protein
MTIHRKRSVIEQADLAEPFPSALRWKHIAMSRTYEQPIFVDPWVLPDGAFGESCGPS